MNKIKLTVFTVTIILLCLLTSCASNTDVSEAEGVTVIDTLGNTATLTPESRVVSCFASYTECWLNAGGTLVGVTDDAVTERELDLDKDTKIVGTVKHIDLEVLVSLSPDYVILSADLAAHLELEESLKQLGISYGYFRVDTFDDYKALMEQFCAVNERDDLFEKYVTEIENNINDILTKVPAESEKEVLLIRAYSTKMKAKGADNLAGQILNELGCENIADRTPSMLEDLSIEQIIADDPDYIFVTTMGSEESALEYIKSNLESDPAWIGLTAIKEGNYYLLPKELFHYKPNHRWDKSYEYLAKIVYPEIFS